MASIEDLLRDIADALRDNTDTLKSMTAAAKKANGGASASTSSRSTKDDDGDDGKAASGRKPRTTKPKAPTAKELGAATTAFLEIEDEEVYEERKGVIKKILAKFDAPKMSEIAEEDRAAAMELLQISIDGGNPFPGRARRDEEDFA